jgi:quercetin dioxygenase-like cupin family protein
MAVITANEAPVFDAGGAMITGLASPSRGSADTAAWRVRFEPDHPSPPHALSREEIFIVLEGELTARFGDREETATAGGALIVAPGEQFTLVALQAPAEAVCIMPIGGQAISDGVTFTPPWAE